jgi:hypothetical protein
LVLAVMAVQRQLLARLVLLTLETVVVVVVLVQRRVLADLVLSMLDLEQHKW